MKQNTASLRRLLSIVVLSVLLLGPTTVPIVTPPATLRTIIACQSQTTGMVVVIDAHGRTYTQTCGVGLRTMLGDPGLYPTQEAPWKVIITVQPASLRAGWPRICRFQIVSAPIHLRCAAIGLMPLAVDFDMILTFAQ